MFDERWFDVEDMPQHEVHRRIVSEPARFVLHLSTVQRIQVAAIERCDDRIAEVWKESAQTEVKPAVGLQQVVRKICDIRRSGWQDDDEVRSLAPVPAFSEAGLESEAEGDGIVKYQESETPLANGFEEHFLEEQLVRIVHQGEPRHPGRELLQDAFAPVSHSVSPLHRCSERPVRVGNSAGTNHVSPHPRPRMESLSWP